MHPTRWIQPASTALPPVPADLFDDMRGALPRHHRLLVGLWLFGGDTTEDNAHAMAVTRRLYARNGRDIDAPRRRFTVGSIVSEIDALLTA